MKTRAKSDLAKKVVAKVAKTAKPNRRRGSAMSTEMMQTVGAVAFAGVCLAIVGATMFRSEPDPSVRNGQRDIVKKVAAAPADDIDERDTVRPRAKTEGLAAFVQAGLEEERKAERERRGETEVAAVTRETRQSDDDDVVPLVRQRGTPMVFDVPRRLERTPTAEPIQPKTAAPAERAPPAEAPARAAEPAVAAAARPDRTAPVAITPTVPTAEIDDEMPAPAAVEAPRAKAAVTGSKHAVSDSKSATAAPDTEAAAQPHAKEPVKAPAPAAAPAPVVAAVEPVRRPQGFPPAPSPRLAEPRIELPDEPQPAVVDAHATMKPAVAAAADELAKPVAPTASPDAEASAQPHAKEPVKAAAPAAAPAPVVAAVETVRRPQGFPPTPSPRLAEPRIELPDEPKPAVVDALATTKPAVAAAAPVAPAAAARIEPTTEAAAAKPAVDPAPMARVAPAPAVAAKPIEVPTVVAKPAEAAAAIVPAKPAETPPVAAKAAPVIAAEPAPAAKVAAKPAEPAASVAKVTPAPAATLQPSTVAVAAVTPAAVAPAAPAVTPEALPAPKSRWEEWSREIFALFAPAKPTFKGAGDIKDCADCPDLMIVPTGFFTMGADAADRDARPQERPALRARITKTFAMGRTEVTVGEYRAFLAATKHAAPDCAGLATAPPSAPVSCVSHADALAYVDWLAGQTGERYRLPSAAEWEYAAKAGRESKSIPVQVAALKGTATDASAEANPFGFVGMGGGVAELVADCFTRSVADAPTDGTAAVVEGGCRNRIVKDGSDAESSAYHRPSSRRAVAFDQRVEGIGFRVAREISTKKR